MTRAVAILACLLLALPLLVAGGLAGWAGGKAVLDSQRARDWVLVKAEVVPGTFGSKPGEPGSGHFAYAFDGKRYEGRRLAFGGLRGSDDIDAWRADVADDLKAAKAAGRSVSVWVNPDAPAESVLGRHPVWDVTLLGALAALGLGGAGLIALNAAGTLAVRAEAKGNLPNATEGSVFFWIFALIWNSFSFTVAWLVLPDILEQGEWGGLFVLLFPFVGVFLIWAAVGATTNGLKAWVARKAPWTSPSRTAPAGGGEAIARGLIDKPSRRAASGPIGVPSTVAEVKQEGGALAIRFLPRRRLPIAAVVLGVGTILTIAGIVMLADGGSKLGGALLLVASVAVDFGGVSLLTGRLSVTARPGEIVVDEGNLFGGRQHALRRESLEWIRPVLSYTVNGVPVYAIRARTKDGETIFLGDSLKGEPLAERYASRLAAAAGFPDSLVRPASQVAGNQD